MQPVRSLSKDDNWKIDFKSARITREVVESMRLVEDKHLRETYNVLHKTPESSSLAGSIFVAIVHRTLSNGQRSDRLTLQATRMVCDNCDPPAFSTDLSSPPSVPDTSSSLPPLRARTKAVTLVNLAHNLSNVTLGNDRYYVQTTTNNPLFDSFAIDRDLDRRTTVISVFQITTSSTHGGSARGYLRIRRIVARVRNLLESEGLNATVKVAYILVCPDDGSRHQWQMPVGWHDDLTHNDHRGDAFCVCVPVSVHRNILRQSTPEKEAEAEVNKRTTKKGKKRATAEDQEEEAPAKALRSSTRLKEKATRQERTIEEVQGEEASAMAFRSGTRTAGRGGTRGQQGRGRGGQQMRT